MNSQQVVPEKRAYHVDPTTILGMTGLILLALSLIGILLAWNWHSWGLQVAILLGVIVGVPVLWRVFKAIHLHSLHHVSIRQHHKNTAIHRQLATRALSMGHSVEMKHTDHLGGTWELRTISPLTIPNAPVTIKELNLGNEQEMLPAPVTQPTMDEVMNAVAYNSLTVGFGRSTKTGQIITQGIVPGVHFKLVGSSGFGKSCLAGALLDVATKRNDPDHLRIALLDLENKTSRLFEALPHVHEVGNIRQRVRLHAKDPDEVARHLALLRKVLDHRAAGQIDTPLLLIYVEEMLSLQYEVDEKLRDQMLADLAILALRGRKYGMFLLACTQTDYSTKELREAQRQFRTRSGFAVDPSAARAAGFTNNELVKYNFQNAKPGQFLLEKPAFSELVLAPLYDVEQKLRELSNPSRIYVPHFFPSSEGSSNGSSSDAEVPLQNHFRQTGNLGRFNEPVKFPEVVNEEKMAYARNIESDRIMRVAKMMLNGLSVNKMLEMEWGITSPGGAYQAALVELREVQKVIAQKAMA